MKWYKRDPDAWRAGVIGLTPEERGIYDTVIELLYSYDATLPPAADDRFFARECNCNPRTWRKVRDALVAKGKLYYEPGGQIMAKRVRKEIEFASNRMRMTAELNQKRLEKQHPTPLGAERKTTTTTREEWARKRAGVNGFKKVSAIDYAKSWEIRSKAQLAEREEAEQCRKR